MSPSRSTINVASASAIRLLPPPARRIESGGRGCSSLSSSRRPRRTVDAEIPVASATTPTPPLPIALASVAAHTRRDRSFSVGERGSYFSCSESTSTQPMSATELGNGQLLFYDPLVPNWILGRSPSDRRPFGLMWQSDVPQGPQGCISACYPGNRLPLPRMPYKRVASSWTTVRISDWGRPIRKASWTYEESFEFRAHRIQTILPTS